MPDNPSPLPPENLPPLRVAVNGYGRIGRSFLRALYETGLENELQVVAINEPANLESILHLTRFDSTHGRFAFPVEKCAGGIRVQGRDIAVHHAATPEAVDWRALEIDLLVECSGRYGERAAIERFLAAGAPRVLLSNPANSAADVDATILYGMNQHELTNAQRIVSNASCTTHAVVPLLDFLSRELGLSQVALTTLHSVMNDQPLIDGYHHADLRRTRSAMQSIIPVSTGLARGVERLLPQLAGRVSAKAIRVPTANVSAIDMFLAFQREATVAHVNDLIAGLAARAAARNLLAYTEEAHASVDFNHAPYSAIVDGSQTRNISPSMVNLFVWFDNEWGFANRMLDVARYWLRCNR
ncbi:MAG: erythrose-4-phosphate dehydrogenase [Zoogloeaceae bacterium]|jgi:glyceraldehyde 3-phosphate dehydrogenase/D-erythrose 4-phosphate dehydrogenase|nr:erythrose-4-phosphate dehydrogenase [Zoogloeaceae bacterium]